MKIATIAIAATIIVTSEMTTSINACVTWRAIASAMYFPDLLIAVWKSSIRSPRRLRNPATPSSSRISYDSEPELILPTSDRANG